MVFACAETFSTKQAPKFKVGFHEFLAEFRPFMPLFSVAEGYLREARSFHLFVSHGA
jgi:hypothetical protein